MISEASGGLSSLGTKTSLNRIPLLIFLKFIFCLKSIQQINTRYKTNEIVNKFLLAGDKFMLEMHLHSPSLHIVLVVHSLKIDKK